MRRYLSKIKSWRLLADQSGATAIEYALMASLIAVAVISSVGLLATRTRESFNKSGDAINPVLGN
ncbi:MAG: Flp family type IVb pilin [Pirellula sp.]|nr:Flp family type IVb pilin [Pirellula sp.]